MNEAWKILKANPRMLDSEGNAVPPAVMNYHYLSQEMDPYGHGFEGDGDREHGVSRTAEAMAQGNHPAFDDDESQQNILQQVRRDAKKHTNEGMKANLHYHSEPKQSIQRMPRPEDEE